MPFGFVVSFILKGKELLTSKYLEVINKLYRRFLLFQV